jgi:hypothetical protein
VKNNGNKEGSSEETRSEEDCEEDRKEEIRKVLWDLGLEKRFSSLFFYLRSSSDIKPHFQKKFKINLQPLDIAIFLDMELGLGLFSF